MPCRRAADLNSARLSLFPPIELGDTPCTTRGEKRGNLERCDPLHIWKTSRQSGYGRTIEMIVVIVRYERDVDGRKLIDRKRRRYKTVRSGKREGRRPIGPDGIGENVQAVALNQERAVANPAERE